MSLNFGKFAPDQFAMLSFESFLNTILVHRAIEVFKISSL